MKKSAEKEIPKVGQGIVNLICGRLSCEDKSMTHAHIDWRFVKQNPYEKVKEEPYPFPK